MYRISLKMCMSKKNVDAASTSLLRGIETQGVRQRWRQVTHVQVMGQVGKWH